MFGAATPLPTTQPAGVATGSGDVGPRLVHNEDFTCFAVMFADLPPDVPTVGDERLNRALKARFQSMSPDETARP